MHLNYNRNKIKNGMKKSYRIIVIAAVIISLAGFFSNEGNAQSLTFSQVLLISSSSTVPSGKVWKVENILPNANTVALTPNPTGPGAATSSSTTESIITVNGFNIRA